MTHHYRTHLVIEEAINAADEEALAGAKQGGAVAPEAELEWRAVHRRGHHVEGVGDA